MDLNTIQNDLGNHLGPYRTDVSVCFVAYGLGSSKKSWNSGVPNGKNGNTLNAEPGPLSYP